MPSVRLRDYETERLPDVCMSCGARATTFKEKSFAWHPPWVLVTVLLGLLPAAILALVLTKRMRVGVPLCDRHRGHWLKRNLFVFGGFFVVLVVGIIALAFLAGPHAGGDGLGGVFCVACVGLLLLWIVVVAVAQSTAIRPTEITDLTITLSGACPAFREALDEQRAARRPERRRYVDIEPPRRAPRPDDDRVSRDDDRLDRPPPRSEGIRDDDAGY